MGGFDCSATSAEVHEMDTSSISVKELNIFNPSLDLSFCVKHFELLNGSMTSKFELISH